MRKLLSAVGLSLLLGACSTLTAIEGTTVSPTAMIVAANSFDAVEATGTNYIKYCTPVTKPVGCSNAAIQALVPAIRSGRIARNNMEDFVKANPGALGPVGLYNALTAATSTLSSIEAQYNVGAVK